MMMVTAPSLAIASNPFTSASFNGGCYRFCPTKRPGAGGGHPRERRWREFLSVALRNEARILKLVRDENNVIARLGTDTIN